MSNSSPALPDSLPACSALLAGKHPLPVSHTGGLNPHSITAAELKAVLLFVSTGDISGARYRRTVPGLPHHGLSGAEQDVLEAEGEVHHQAHWDEKDRRPRSLR